MQFSLLQKQKTILKKIIMTINMDILTKINHKYLDICGFLLERERESSTEYYFFTKDTFAHCHLLSDVVWFPYGDIQHLIFFIQYLK